MKRYWSLLALSAVLGACSQSQSRQVVDNLPADATYPARLSLMQISLPVVAAPAQPAGGEWWLANGELSFGLLGRQKLFTLACDQAPAGGTALRITWVTRAEAGAKALVALIGNGRIARLPVDVVRAGERGEWGGIIPAADPRLDVLKGSNRIEATLPGGGTLILPASGEPGRLLAACRAIDRSPVTAPA
ncbi:MAG: hypothetical protein FP826_07530 [Sphingomonadales bacterium]|nr:hypothetical protein [Sphingomonadales bacterium]MBU3991869.1 hypothetical protein [Alphaproteobacteria bacterium]